MAIRGLFRYPFGSNARGQGVRRLGDLLVVAVVGVQVPPRRLARWVANLYSVVVGNVRSFVKEPRLRSVWLLYYPAHILPIRAPREPGRSR